MLESPRRSLSRHEVDQMLEATRGAWGQGKTLDTIDADIERIRAEWDRTERSD